MYTYEIQYVLDHGIWIKNLQAKVCAKDQLTRQNPSHVKAYIVNTERSNKAGEHWVVVIFNNNGNVIYFDSHGLPPLETEIIDFRQSFIVVEIQSSASSKSTEQSLWTLLYLHIGCCC